ncbi:MAG: DEAD/DEAH box helicase family protein [Bacteroidaceae bacterium]|nr:DEAD/DEAH box helicase family protein [Bacteroidaceae bacterium]
MKTDISLELAHRLSADVNAAFADGSMMEAVTPVTADLLRYWFTEAYMNERRFNFHDGQRQSILNVIYLHEVLKVESVSEIYEKAAPDLMVEADMEAFCKEKYNIPKYAVKMATGTGKTWVMHALLLWQMLNARHEEEKSGRYTKNFLIVAPGLVVYDRLLDAYLGRLKPGSNERDPSTNDFYRNQELFIPPQYRDEVFGFIQNNVVSKEDGIGRKITGDGFIGLTNWHLFLGYEEEQTEDELPDAPPAIIGDILPLRPGVSAGNALDALDRQYLRGNELEYLAEMTDLMVINDEAHHIHENMVAGEVTEVEWQRGLNYIAQSKGKRFFQIDFSATPYDTSGSGKKKTKHYFPHIVVDFDLTTAMKQGLVKTLLLDKRQELTELEGLDYKAVRDERNKVVGLSEGQRLMLRAGLAKLRILEEGFVKIDAAKYPKMLVMCEDTSVTPFVEKFLMEEGLMPDDVLRIDSTAKGELKDAEWMRVKERLFNVDNYALPKVIVSVLMLREGFDVNNICVIVPLRSSQASILLEQTVGRGLRLMWREPEYQEEKMENRRNVLIKKQQPKSYIDMLSIVEHPAFDQFYKELMAEGLAGTDEGELSGGGAVTGDLIKVGLKENYADYDMFWPMVIRDAEEEITPSQIDLRTLQPFTAFSLDHLRTYLATGGETFVSQAVITETTFGRYQVKADLFTATSYNEYLMKLLRTITTRMDRVGARATRELPTLQINQREIIRIMDIYIRTRLFGTVFNPFEGNDWKILLSKNAIVTQHIIKEMSLAIHRMQESVMTSEAVVEKLWFSAVATLRIRESYSMELEKVIYERVGYPSNKGGFEKAFSEFLDRDESVERFLKINESQHRFASLFYIREDGLLASYHPDFMVCTDNKVYIIETKGDDKVLDKNVQRKKLATVEWCKKINQLDEENRMNRMWEYVLLSETSFYALARSGATLEEICALNKVSMSESSGRLFEE